MDESNNFTKFAPEVSNGNNCHLWAVRMGTYLEAPDFSEAVKKETDTNLPEDLTMHNSKHKTEKE